MGVTVSVSSRAAPTAVTGGTADCDPSHRVGVPCFSLVSEPFSGHTNDGFVPLCPAMEVGRVPTLEEKQKPLAVQDTELILPPDPPEYQDRQHRTMVVALCLLLVALAVVIVRDRDFWFPSSPETQADATEPESDGPALQPGQALPSTPLTSKAKKKPAPAAKEESKAPAPLVTAERRALPPLQIEVVAGDERRTVHPGNTSVKVELQPRVPPRPAEEATVESQVLNGPAVNASERVRLSPETTQAVSHPVNPDYPLLARQMKVQGSVILQALIGRDGSIQDLRVVSGPAILAAAAREAVKQWRFKPYLQDGSPIETQARIIVNFTISTT